MVLKKQVTTPVHADSDRYVTFQEAAEISGKSFNALRQLIQSGKLRTVGSGAALRVDRTQLRPTQFVKVGSDPLQGDRVKPRNIIPSGYVSVSEAANRLGVKTSQIYSWCVSRREVFEIVNGRWYVDWTAASRALQVHKVNTRAGNRGTQTSKSMRRKSVPRQFTAPTPSTIRITDSYGQNDEIHTPKIALGAMLQRLGAIDQAIANGRSNDELLKQRDQLRYNIGSLSKAELEAYDKRHRR